MKRVVLCPNPYRDKNFKTVLQAQRILHEAGVETSICLSFEVDKGMPLPQNITFSDFTQELKRADCLICFGGDGTILHASKAATAERLPVLGVNIGTMGFMAELESTELELLRLLADDRFELEERMMLSVRVERDGACVFHEAGLNDAVITKGAVARTIQLAVDCDGIEAMNFSGDGLIVCTPTGSTAYSMSAGGPIVEVSARNIILTPICAHDFKTRPIVTSDSRTITVMVGKIGRKNAFLSVDGGRAIKLGAGDRVTICTAKEKTRLLRLKERSFFEIIHNKFK